MKQVTAGRGEVRQGRGVADARTDAGRKVVTASLALAVLLVNLITLVATFVLALRWTLWSFS